MSRNREKRNTLVPIKAPSGIRWSEETRRKVGFIGLAVVFGIIAIPIICSVMFSGS